MGHRHQTYILVTDEVRKETTLTVYHCQWNYPAIQIPKLLRFMEYFLPQLNEIYHSEAQSIPKMYKYTASLAPGNFIRHTDITHEYKECQDYVFSEDNNNGWLLIHVKLYDDKTKNHMLIGFKPGSEDLHHRGKESNSETEKFTNLFYYLSLVLSSEERKELYAEGTLAEHERHILEYIDNRGFDQDELRNSTDLLKVKARQLYESRVKI